jgi:hypothetical protein
MSSDRNNNEASMGSYEDVEHDKRMPRNFKIPQEAKSVGGNIYEVSRKSPAKPTRPNRFSVGNSGLKDRYFKQGNVIIKNPTVSTTRVLEYPIEYSPGGKTRLKNKVSPRHLPDPRFSIRSPN